MLISDGYDSVLMADSVLGRKTVDLQAAQVNTSAEVFNHITNTRPRVPHVCSLKSREHEDKLQKPARPCHLKPDLSNPLSHLASMLLRSFCKEETHVDNSEGGGGGGAH